MRRTQLKPGMEVARYVGTRVARQSLLESALLGEGTVDKVMVRDCTVKSRWGLDMTDCDVPGCANPTAVPLRQMLCPWVEYEAAVAAHKQARRAQAQKDREEREAADRRAAELRHRWALADTILHTRGMRLQYDEHLDKVSLTLDQLEKLL